MARKTKITLSEHELAVASEADWILTKWEVMNTACDLLGSQVDIIRRDFIGDKPLLSMIPDQLPKISKGENYERLPYAILDYPRHFSREGTFALRTMFWWAHFFSVTLQVSGNCLPIIRKRLIDEPFIPENEVWFCQQDDPWQHHFGKDNYCLLSSVDTDERLAQIGRTGFVKLAMRFGLEDWNRMPGLLATAYKTLAAFIA